MGVSVEAVHSLNPIAQQEAASMHKAAQLRELAAINGTVRSELARVCGATGHKIAEVRLFGNCIATYPLLFNFLSLFSVFPFLFYLFFQPKKKKNMFAGCCCSVRSATVRVGRRPMCFVI